MNTVVNQGRDASPFTRRTVLAVVLAGFAIFVAMLYFIGAGDTGGNRNNGAAHGAAVGLNGYAGLARLLEGEGYDVSLSRSPAGLETSDLLILTPELAADPDELGEILEKRSSIGPTLVILPKWRVSGPPRDAADDVADRFKDGWVRLTGVPNIEWTEELPAPFTLTRKGGPANRGPDHMWTGLGHTGNLPSPFAMYLAESENHEPLIANGRDRSLAVRVSDNGYHDFSGGVYPISVIAEPDLLNNYGLADADRASVALALVREAADGQAGEVTFDLTLNGFGGSSNLLTLAFQPPFLAATLCLILASLIVGWRAFMRFGPVQAGTPEIAFGKDRLVRNGAGLIVRARRFGLLAEPYAALSQRRLGKALGIARPDAQSIDAALAARLPGEEPFSRRANRLAQAETASDILHAAQALKELEGKLTR